MKDIGTSFDGKEQPFLWGENPVQHMHINQVDSTNTEAKRYLEKAPLSKPLLITCDQQSAGRGRGKNTWFSGAGALTFSLVLPMEISPIPMHDWPAFSPGCALAVALALDRVNPDLSFRVKWPNDVFLHGKKCAGILIEPAGKKKEYLILGIGINVANTLPSELAKKAISLVEAGENPPPASVLQAVLNTLHDWVKEPHREDVLEKLWSEKDVLAGKTVTLDTSQGEISGTVLGIHKQGALRLKTNLGEQYCWSGTITSF